MPDGLTKAAGRVFIPLRFFEDVEELPSIAVDEDVYVRGIMIHSGNIVNARDIFDVWEKVVPLSIRGRCNTLYHLCSYASLVVAAMNSPELQALPEQFNAFVRGNYNLQGEGYTVRPLSLRTLTIDNVIRLSRGAIPDSKNPFLR